MVLALSLLSALPASAIIAERCAISACATCDCYWSSECGTGKKCDYASGCTKSGKKDGTCTTANAEVVIASSFEVASALSFWFDAYIAAANEERDGLPDEALVKRALDSGMSERAHALVRDEVINALDILLGFDAVLPRGDCQEHDPRCLAQLRIPAEPEAVELLEVAKEALIGAVLNGDPSNIGEALGAFWNKSAFEPHHTGRCYPHGHEGFSTPLECQTDELRRVATLLISSTRPKPLSREPRGRR
ncbi:MAG TPA: hypothetical protein VFR31_21475 [Thermoanaerobaculia bacterium]|nr:hypothetical protein [Thermoanaerobaculia bacterium]